MLAAFYFSGVVNWRLSSGSQKYQEGIFEQAEGLPKR